MSCLCSKIYALAKSGDWSFGDGSIVCQECLREYDARQAAYRALFVHDWHALRRECVKCGLDEFAHQAADPPGVPCTAKGVAS